MSFKTVKNVILLLQKNGFVLKDRKEVILNSRKKGESWLFQIMEAKVLKKEPITVFWNKQV